MAASHETPRETDTSEMQPRELSRPYYGLGATCEMFLMRLCSGLKEHCSDLVVIPTGTEYGHLQPQIQACGAVGGPVGSSED